MLGGEPDALLLGLGQMDMEQGIELPGRVGDVGEHREGHRVGGMGGEADLDAVVVAVAPGVEVDDLRRSACPTTASSEGAPGSCRTPGVTRARDPAATTASASASSKK